MINQDVPVELFTVANLLDLRYAIKKIAEGVEFPTEIHIHQDAEPGIKDCGIVSMPMPNGRYGKRPVHMILIHPQTWREIEMRLMREKDSQGAYYWQPSIDAAKPQTIAGMPIYDHTK